MNWGRIKALVRKDVGEVFASKMTVLPLVIVPVVLCVIVPVGIMVAGFLLDVAVIQGAQFLEKISRSTRSPTR